MDVNKKVVELNIDDILPNRFQPRIKFNEESIIELSNSIKEHGVIQPIVVRPLGDKYEIIAGERRFKASIMAGLTKIPAIITDLNDKDSAEVALIENIQRQNLTPIEEAISYKKILDMGYLTQESLASKLGKTQSTIANKLRLLNLDEDVQEALLEGRISERHARSILKLKDFNQQREILEKIISNRLTVRKTDEEIDKMLNLDNNIDNSDVEIIDFDEPTNIPKNPIIDEVQNNENNFQFNEENNEEKPGKFFNIMEDDNKEINNDFNIDEPIDYEKRSFSFSDLYESRENSDESNQENRFINNMSFSNSKDISRAIGMIKDTKNMIERDGFSIEMDEVDLNDSYQIIIKINK